MTGAALKAATMAEELATLEERKAALTRELARALRWRDFAPDCFDKGAMTVSYIGARPEGTREWPLEQWRLELKRADGSRQLFPLGEVPLELVAADIAGRPEFRRLCTSATAEAFRDGQRAAIAGESVKPWAGMAFPYDSACGRAFRAGYRIGGPVGWTGKDSGNG